EECIVKSFSISKPCAAPVERHQRDDHGIERFQRRGRAIDRLFQPETPFRKIIQALNFGMDQDLSSLFHTGNDAAPAMYLERRRNKRARFDLRTETDVTVNEGGPAFSKMAFEPLDDFHARCMPQLRR